MIAALLAPSLSAQGVYYTWPNTISGNTGMASAGDVDGDGTQDFLIGDGGLAAIGQISHVRVRSGGNGNVLLDIASTRVDDGFGRTVGLLGDVDLDGHLDFVVGASNTASASTPPSTPYVCAVSGLSGSLLWQTNSPDPDLALGVSIALLGDVDSDGFPDVAVGAPSAIVTKLGQVLVLSGRTGAVLHAIAQVPGSTQNFGGAVAAAGDFDQDGKSDVLVGDTQYQSGLPGRVTVHSSSSGALIQLFAGLAPSSYFGTSVASAGDIDGDFVPDLLISAPNEPILPSPATPTGRVRLYSGATGMTLLTLDPQGPPTHLYGNQIASYQDLDGDGLRDVVIMGGFVQVGCCHTIRGDLIVRSSATGNDLLRIPQQASPFAVVPDADADGIEDFLLAGLIPPGTSVGLLDTGLMMTGLQLPVVDPGCPPKQNSVGGFSYLVSTGAPSLTYGPDLSITAYRVMGNSVGLLAWSLQPAALPFGGGTLCLGGSIHRSHAQPTGGTVGLADGGSISYTFSKAQLAALGYAPGTQFHVQAWYRDVGFPAPNSIGLSGSMTATVWP